MHAVQFVIKTGKVGFGIPGRERVVAGSVDIGYHSSPR
jgi:hypothetical protein